MQNEQGNAREFSNDIFDKSWESFREQVIPDDAGRYQRASMCQAFIGGALAYRVAMSAAFGAEDTPEQDALARLATVDASVDAMAHQFMDGLDALVLTGDAIEHTNEHGQREITPNPDSRVVHADAIEAPNLKPSDLADLTEVIKAFVTERGAQNAAAAATEQGNE
jgi:hypothetical protein